MRLLVEFTFFIRVKKKPSSAETSLHANAAKKNYSGNIE